MAITSPNRYSAPILSYDILSRLSLINDRVFSAYVKQYPQLGLADSYVMKMEASGASKYSPTLKWRQWQDNERQRPAFQVTTNASAGSPTAGSAITVQLTTPSHTGAGTLSAPAVGMIFEDHTTGRQYEVRATTKTATNAHTVQLAPVKASETANFTTASVFVSHGRPSVKEASGFQDGNYSAYTNLQKELSAIRTNKSYTDLAWMEKLEMDGKSYRTMDNIDAEHVIDQEFALMFGLDKDNLTNASGNRNTAAKGVIPTVKSEGTDLGGAVLSATYFENIYRTTMANGYSSSYDVLHGPEFYLKYQAFLKADALDFARVQYPSDTSGEIQALFDFKPEVEIYGVKMNLKPYKFFNTQLLAGADVATGVWNSFALFVPTGTYYNQEASDTLPYLRVRYMSTEEGGERTLKGEDGMLLGQGNDAKAELSLLSWKGVEMYAPKGFMFATPS